MLVIPRLPVAPQEVLAARLRTLEGEAQLRREGELKRMARRQQVGGG